MAFGWGKDSLGRSGNTAIKNAKNTYIYCLETLPIYNAVLSKPVRATLQHIPDHRKLTSEQQSDIYNVILHVLKYGDSFVNLVSTKQGYRLNIDNKKTSSINYEFVNKSLLESVSSSKETNYSINQIVKQLFSYDKAINSLHLQSDRYSQMYLKANDIANIDSRKGAENLRSQANNVNEERNVNEIMITGIKDELGFVTPDFTGFDSILRALQINICMVFSIPFTKLFGESATGLGATGEGDRKDWTQNLHGYYTQYFLPLYKMFQNLPEYKNLDFSFIDFDNQKELIESIKTTAETLEIATLNDYLTQEEARQLFRRTISNNSNIQLEE